MFYKIDKCLNCNAPLPERSRRDRKYCPYKYGIIDFCKNAVNNKNTLADYHSNKELVKINIANRKALRELLGTEESRVVSYEQLFAAGVKMRYYINRATMNGTEEHSLLYLEFGLHEIGENQYKIFRHGTKF